MGLAALQSYNGSTTTTEELAEERGGEELDIGSLKIRNEPHQN